MVLFNHSTRELTAKVVYYGPGLCGKTTNLRVLHERLDKNTVGKLLSLSTAQDRTIYFDLLPVELGNIKGYTVRFQLCTVPGQVFYNETRKLVLKGVDGIVFVADSQRPLLQKNAESLQNLRDNLQEVDRVLDSIPLVIQFNKRDLPVAVPVAEMQEFLSFKELPFVEAIASQGKGVVETFKLVSRLTFTDLLRRLQKTGPVDVSWDALIDRPRPKDPVPPEASTVRVSAQLEKLAQPPSQTPAPVKKLSKDDISLAALTGQRDEKKTSGSGAFPVLRDAPRADAPPPPREDKKPSGVFFALASTPREEKKPSGVYPPVQSPGKPEPAVPREEARGSQSSPHVAPIPVPETLFPQRPASPPATPPPTLETPFELGARWSVEPTDDVFPPPASPRVDSPAETSGKNRFVPVPPEAQPARPDPMPPQVIPPPPAPAPRLVLAENARSNGALEEIRAVADGASAQARAALSEIRSLGDRLLGLEDQLRQMRQADETPELKARLSELLARVSGTAQKEHVELLTRRLDEATASFAAVREAGPGPRLQEALAAIQDQMAEIAERVAVPHEDPRVGGILDVLEAIHTRLDAETGDIRQQLTGQTERLEKQALVGTPGMREELETLNARVEGYANVLSEMRETIATLETRLVDVSTRVPATPAEEERLPALLEKFELLSARIESLPFEKLTKRLSLLEAMLPRVEALDAALGQLTCDALELKQEVSALAPVQERVALLETQLPEAVNRLSAGLQEMEDRTSLVAVEAATGVSEVKAGVSRLQEDLAAEASARREASQAVQALESLRPEIRSLDEKLETQVRAHEETRGDLIALSGIRAEVEELREHLAGQMQAREEDHGSLETLAGLKQEVTVLREQLLSQAEAQAEARRTLEAFEQLKGDVQTLKDQFAGQLEARDQSRQALSGLDAVKAEVERLGREIATEAESHEKTRRSLLSIEALEFGLRGVSERVEGQEKVQQEALAASVDPLKRELEGFRAALTDGLLEARRSPEEMTRLIDEQFGRFRAEMSEHLSRVENAASQAREEALLRASQNRQKVEALEERSKKFYSALTKALAELGEPNSSES